MPEPPHPAAFVGTVLDEIPAPLVIFNLERRYIYCNKQAIRNPDIRAWIIGHTDLEYCIHRGFDVQLAHNRNKHFDEAERTKETITFEETFVTSSGLVRQLRHLTPILNSEGEIQYYLGYGLDISALREAEDQLHKLNQQLEDRVRARTAELESVTRQLQYEALHDALTGLPNRTMFSRRLGALLTEPHGSYAAFVLDTDHFKSVNDALGHPIGDRLLVLLAGRLGQMVASEGLLARLGGDEFGVLLPVAGVEEAQVRAEQLLSLLSQPFHIYSHELLITGSLGVVYICPDYHEASEVMRDADIALYRAKAAGRSSYQMFSPQMREEVLSLINTEKDLRKAIKRQELRVYFQPIMELSTRKLRGFEALLRWQHPTRGLLTPYHFIQIAENSGLIVELDRWVLRAAVQQFHSWLTQHPDSRLGLSVNVSGHNFGRRNIIPELRELVQEFSLRPGQLNLELTESILMDHSQSIGDILNQIRDLGVNLHIDDFGTGYSSLSYLQAYPLNSLKIDRSFIQHLPQQSSSTELVRTMITMSQNLHMNVTAEGIETAEQLNLLQQLHCTYGQGYYFAPPLDAQAAYQFWREHL